MGINVRATGAMVDRTDPGYALIATQAAGAATYNFTAGLTAKYNAYLFSLVNVKPATDDVGFWLRVYVAGIVQSGASDYDWANVTRTGATSDAANDTADSEVELVNSALGAGLAVGNAATEGVNGNIFMYNPVSTSQHKRFRSDLVFSNANGNAGVSMCCGIYKGTAAITGVQFLFESGDIDSGTIRLYGLKR